MYVFRFFSGGSKNRDSSGGDESNGGSKGRSDDSNGGSKGRGDDRSYGRKSKGDDFSSVRGSSRHRSMDNGFTVRRSLSRSASTRAGEPIMFSYSIARRKPPAQEKTLECTLEDLLHGCVKKVMLTREVLADTGLMVEEQELLRIKVKPGWKTGTKITFEGIGDERPGMLPADVTFSVLEQKHPLFQRDGNDLILTLQIPLVKALTGCNISIPLLGGEKMSCSFSDIIYPGYEKIIAGQGMPIANEDGRRGNLRVIFGVEFPKKLSSKQKKDVWKFLQDCN